MIDKNEVIQLAEEYLSSSDCYLIHAEVKPDNIIVVEIDHDEAVSIDDCVALSRYIEERLDRNVEDYELEVGSAGIASPFRIVRQYKKNVGNEVEVLLCNGIKMKGILLSADEQAVTISVAKQMRQEGSKRKMTVREERSYPYNEIKYTKNIISIR
ncbi:MAG: ribosome assembly cofactor RimP [Tannerella sp.]|jgi:ribosome maturation factor RimP|nr:ribosome assembly cofactor RimP [Tannerella sp.]